jgi:hypothetical protein
MTRLACHQKERGGSTRMGTRCAVLMLVILVGGCSAPTTQHPTTTSTSPSAQPNASTTAATPTAAGSHSPSTTPPPANTTAQHPGAPPAGNVTPSKPAAPPPRWADPAVADIYPGTNLGTNSSGCSSNFLFTSVDNRHIYLGTADHCVLVSGVDGIPCHDFQSLPLGSPILLWHVGPLNENATILNITGTLAYSSALTMKDVHEDPNSQACSSNDFALIELPLNAQHRITPAVPTFATPTSIANASDIKLLDPMVGYGASGNYLGFQQFYPRHGYVSIAPKNTTVASGVEPATEWGFTVTMYPPGIFGDSGGLVMTSNNGAAGVIVSIGATGTFCVTLATALAYMEAHTSLRVKLAEL